MRHEEDVVSLDGWRAGTERSQLAITAGTEVGALLVDGLGDGALIECPGEDLEFLRLMTFGMLQVCCA